MKDLRQLHGAKGIRTQGRALLSGARLTAEALRFAPERCLGWITPPGGEGPPPEAPPECVHYELLPELFRELDASGTQAPLVLLSVPPIPAWDPAGGLPPGASLLLPFQDPENVGAAVRSALAFGVARTVVLAECAHPYHPKALRASGGAALRMEFLAGPSLARLPALDGIVALSAEGVDLEGFAFPDPFALLPGLEGEGLPPAWRERSVAIRIRPEVESLNAAAAVAVALYRWSRSSG